MANILTRRRLLGFKDFFPNEIPDAKEAYVNKLGKKLLEDSCCHFLSFFRNKKILEVEEIIENWFTFNDFKFINSPSYWVIKNEFERIKNFDTEGNFAIISVESLLNMFMWLQENEDLPIESTGFDASLTMPFFKIHLLFNDEVLRNYKKAGESIMHFGNDRKIQRLIFACTFPQHDLINVDYAQLFYSQMYKKTKLLEFLSKQSKYELLIQKLLKDFCCLTTEDFFIAISNAVYSSLNMGKSGCIILNIPDDSERNKKICILENFVIDGNDTYELEGDDYLMLRKKPLQKIKEGKYRVIYDLFLIKKLYNGLIKKLSSYDENFTGIIRDEFSEGVLVYDCIKRILNFEEWKTITGNQFKVVNLKVAPDFYARKGNDIMLFESKDFFMNGASKLSYDFTIIENNLKTNGKSPKEDRLMKACSQLLKNTERVILKEMPLDNEYEAETIRIFPIIIVHDSLYSAPALNYWIYYWFIDKLETLKTDIRFEGFDFNRIMPLTIIEIDILILYQQCFVEKQFDLLSLIENYQQFVRFDLAGKLPPQFVEEHAMKSALSFSEFVRNQAHNLNIEIDFKIITPLLKNFGIS